MGNLNYKRGRQKEYQLTAKLRGQGWTVFRTAGSHGTADLIAFKNGEEPRLIQVKSSVNLREYQLLYKEVKDGNNNFEIEFHKFPIKTKEWYAKFNLRS